MRGLWSPGWIARHLGAVTLVVGFLLLGWWQLGRATGGNTLSWAYALQWPVFAAFVLLIWAREVRDWRRARAGPDQTGPTGDAGPNQDAAPGNPAEPGDPARRPVLRRRPVVVPHRSPAPDGSADPELAAYNRYLAWLSEHPGARPSDYPG